MRNKPEFIFLHDSEKCWCERGENYSYSNRPIRDASICQNSKSTSNPTAAVLKVVIRPKSGILESNQDKSNLNRFRGRLKNQSLFRIHVEFWHVRETNDINNIEM
jgi:hypothetical protein